MSFKKKIITISPTDPLLDSFKEEIKIKHNIDCCNYALLKIENHQNEKADTVLKSLIQECQSIAISSKHSFYILQKSGMLDLLKHKQILLSGKKTYEIAQSMGLKHSFYSKKYLGQQSIINVIEEKKIDNILYIHSKKAEQCLQKYCNEKNISFKSHILYNLVENAEEKSVFTQHLLDNTKQNIESHIIVSSPSNLTVLNTVLEEMGGSNEALRNIYLYCFPNKTFEYSEKNKIKYQFLNVDNFEDAVEKII